MFLKNMIYNGQVKYLSVLVLNKVKHKKEEGKWLLMRYYKMTQLRLPLKQL